MKKTQQGFTLFEIIVTLLLLSFILSAIPWRKENREHQRILSSLDILRRGVRVATNESVLRNTLVRLHFQLSKEPSSFVIEYATAPNHIIRPQTTSAEGSLAEKQQKEKILEKFNQNFSKIPDYEKFETVFHSDVKILGISTEVENRLVSTEDISLYFYPTGEKDSALILFATTHELVSFEVLPYSDKMQHKLFPMGTNLDEIGANHKELAEDLYKKWKGQI
ncbi:MAG: prepilin-type N-terminal cleavage/methylation domain-containing protein [Bacteriovoracaceae bacterium]|nr:prepilin-type N-terminal cleavage/methylation domain-containing protein [Bacteriovoracaceae bacterium]